MLRRFQRTAVPDPCAEARTVEISTANAKGI
jgi:hypothetical protein